jgi:UDP-N-acetylmuramyl pentapeptide phosphotransferase/UDP-N-acetylglucosamine-1-phosphate transferase
MQLSLFALFSFVLSTILNKGCLSICQKTGLFIDPVRNDLPQKFHKKPVPRAGGIPIFLAFVISSLILNHQLGIYICLVSLPVFLSGIIEDLTHKISPAIRLAAAFISASLGVIFLGGIVENLGYLILPFLPAFLFTVVAVAGTVNSVNIIDGLNGLTSGTVILANIFIALALYHVGDYQLMTICLLSITATLGFYVFNIVKGKIFLGDGGAYFLGFLLAETSILMVNRNPDISPWFPLAVLIYPVFEVLFSFYRRKIKKNMSPFEADGLHLHTLLFKRRTNRIAIKATMFIYILIVPFMIAALFLHSNKYLLTLLVILFFLVYYKIYSNIVKYQSFAKSKYQLLSFLNLLKSGTSFLGKQGREREARLVRRQ